MINTITEKDLELHKKWINGDPDGVRLVTGIGKILIEADLRMANLSVANLRGADLSGASLIEADLSNADLSDADLSRADLSRADLRGANLSGVDLRMADLRGANLIGANLDFSSWPLWCGSKNVKVDARIAAQLAAHFCALDCDDPDYRAARAELLPFAMTSHRAGNLGIAPKHEDNVAQVE